MVKVYALRLDDQLDESWYQALISKTGVEKQNKINSFFRKEDALRALFADLLIRHILIQDFSLKNENISFKYSSYGKPCVEGLANFHFNISHSGEWIVCAIDEDPVGIDIEFIAPIDLQIAETYFSIDEKNKLFSLEPSLQVAFFYELWTLKESYLKLNGMGLSMPLDSFTILVDEKGRTTFKSTMQTPAVVFFKQVNLDPLYKMSICALHNSIEDIAILSMQQLNSFFNE